MLRTVAAAAAVMVALAAGPAAAEGDAKAGKRAFNKCKACHIADDKKNRVGPHLVGLFGRTAGGAEGFKYSPAMIEAGKKGLVWNDKTVDEYLKDPKGYVEGNRMAFPGLKSDKERADIIAYLKEETKP